MEHLPDCPWREGFDQVLSDRDYEDFLHITEEGVTFEFNEKKTILTFNFCPMCGAKRGV